MVYQLKWFNLINLLDQSVLESGDWISHAFGPFFEYMEKIERVSWNHKCVFKHRGIENVQYSNLVQCSCVYSECRQRHWLMIRWLIFDQFLLICIKISKVVVAIIMDAVRSAIQIRRLPVKCVFLHKCGKKSSICFQYATMFFFFSKSNCIMSIRILYTNC